jgi:hypothetical protein
VPSGKGSNRQSTLREMNKKFKEDDEDRHRIQKRENELLQNRLVDAMDKLLGKEKQEEVAAVVREMVEETNGEAMEGSGDNIGGGDEADCEGRENMEMTDGKDAFAGHQEELEVSELHCESTGYSPSVRGDKHPQTAGKSPQQPYVGAVSGKMVHLGGRTVASQADTLVESIEIDAEVEKDEVETQFERFKRLKKKSKNWMKVLREQGDNA